MTSTKCYMGFSILTLSVGRRCPRISAASIRSFKRMHEHLPLPAKDRSHFGRIFRDRLEVPRSTLTHLSGTLELGLQLVDGYRR